MKSTINHFSRDDWILFLMLLIVLVIVMFAFLIGGY